MDSRDTWPWVAFKGIRLQIYIVCHPDSIVVGLWLCVWKVTEVIVSVRSSTIHYLCPVSVHCDRDVRHVPCLNTVTGQCVMSCVCILWQGCVSCPVVCILWWDVMFCVCTLWQGEVLCPVSVYCDRVVSCPVSLYCNRVGSPLCSVSVFCDTVVCHVLCLYTVMPCSAMSCVCILWRMVYHVLCFYPVSGWCAMSSVYSLAKWGVAPCVSTLTGWHVVSCVSITWQGDMSWPMSI